MKEAPSNEGASLVSGTPPPGRNREWLLVTVGVWLSGERSIDSIHQTISRICLADGLNLIDADTKPFANIRSISEVLTT
jgi:hypothetical protein